MPRVWDTTDGERDDPAREYDSGTLVRARKLQSPTNEGTNSTLFHECGGGIEKVEVFSGEIRNRI